LRQNTRPGDNWKSAVSEEGGKGSFMEKHFRGTLRRTDEWIAGCILRRGKVEKNLFSRGILWEQKVISS